MAIWVVEQRDPSDLLYSCIACCNEEQAHNCLESFQQNLTSTQQEDGWQATVKTVDSWDDVPASALKLN
jgi:hypothetical protein